MVAAHDTGTPMIIDTRAGADPGSLRSLLDAVPTLVRWLAADGECEWCNSAWLAFTGRALQQERGAGWIEGIHPDDRDRCVAAQSTARAPGQPFSVDYRLRRHDGDYRWIRDAGTPLGQGGLSGVMVSGVDVTDLVEREAAQREALRRQEALTGEVSHRLKNSLATVHSIALQTFRKVPEVETPLRLFDGRLSAVAAAQDLLARRGWRGASIRDAVEVAVRPFAEIGSPMAMISGPEVMLTPRQTAALSFAVHELCSNAARFGALSMPGGRVRVQWEAEPGEAGTSVVLNWREEGGPKVVPPTRKGFGARMIERGLTHELSASTQLDFLPEGVQCTIRAELPPWVERAYGRSSA